MLTPWNLSSWFFNAYKLGGIRIHFKNDNSVYHSALKKKKCVSGQGAQEQICLGIQPQKAGPVVSVVFWYFAQTGRRQLCR